MPAASVRPVWARVDDLVDGSALLLAGPSRLVVAWRPEEVVSALAEVDRACADGAWAVGYVAYEAASGLDPLLTTHAPVVGDPLVWFAIVDEPQHVPVIEAHPDAAGRPDSDTQEWVCDWSQRQHGVAVETVREAIARGETYQVNLTTRFRGRIAPAEAPQWYADLALGQRGRYNAYLDAGSLVVGSASPELFFEVGADGHAITMRPMKGTAARGRNTAEDAALAGALVASPKERAENVMIVDLLRNDLARIADVGTVAVPALCRVERYETVHQLTSDVTATLRADLADAPGGVGLGSIFKALFPCGSITGAPKRRTMDIITELESSPRGVYCGAIGVVAPPGAAYRARFSVAIRTVVARPGQGGAWPGAVWPAEYGAGGGITWSSRAESEHAEVLAKTAVLHRRAREFHLFETMRWEFSTSGEGGVRHLDRHLARLADSADYLGFTWDESAARALIGEHVAALQAGVGQARVRVTLERDGRMSVQVGEVPPPVSGLVRVALDASPIDPQDWRWQHKTSLREPYERRRAARPDVDDVLLVNDSGEVTESTIANVAVLLDGQWVTPPVRCGCLPGVERAALLADGTLHEQVITVADLRRAERLALINALRGSRDAVLVD